MPDKRASLIFFKIYENHSIRTGIRGIEVAPDKGRLPTSPLNYLQMKNFTEFLGYLWHCGGRSGNLLFQKYSRGTNILTLTALVGPAILALIYGPIRSCFSNTFSCGYQCHNINVNFYILPHSVFFLAKIYCRVSNVLKYFVV